MSSERFVRGVLIAGSAVFVAGGAWCLVDPASFYEQVALFEPYNRHFLHDIGAFQLGLGTALALGLTRMDGRRLALWAAAVASVLHAVSHAVDSELGGRDTDLVGLSLLAVIFVSGAIVAGRATREVTSDGTGEPDAGVRPTPPTRALDRQHR